MALVGGLIALVLGLIGIITWWPYFIKALAAGVPVMLILGGALATYLGIEELTDKKAALKQDVETPREELKELKGENGPEKEEDKAE